MFIKIFINYKNLDPTQKDLNKLFLIMVKIFNKGGAKRLFKRSFIKPFLFNEELDFMSANLITK
jgi:hypothetical protein